MHVDQKNSCGIHVQCMFNACRCDMHVTIHGVNSMFYLNMHGLCMHMHACHKHRMLHACVTCTLHDHMLHAFV